MDIKTPNNWWDVLDTHWQNILDIFQNVGAPLQRDPSGRMYSDGLGLEPTMHTKTLIHTLEDAKKDRDHETMHDFLQKAWSAAPDKPYIHKWPSWSALCDLCSEYWVFDSAE